MGMFLTPGYLRHYRLSARPPARAERVLAVGRAFLTVSGLVAIYLDPTEPARLREVTYVVLLAYAVHSIAALAFVQGAARLTHTHGRVLHALDILWTSALTFVSQGPVSPFFLFFLFVVLAAAYRGGFRETVATAAIIVGVFLAETALAALGPWNERWSAAIDFELNRTILRVTYLLLIGFLLGYLAEEEKQSQAESAAIADASRLPQGALGFGGSVSAVARWLLATFEAHTVAVAVREEETGRAYLWTVRRSEAGSDEQPVRRVELDDRLRRSWLFQDPGRAWSASSAHTGSSSALATEAGIWPLTRTHVHVPAPVADEQGRGTVTAVNLGLSKEWQGRVYLFHPTPIGAPERSLHFLEALADHVTPAMTNVFLLRRLRARAGAAERARVARELHDGAIQALFAIEMKIEALRRASQRETTSLDESLAEVQDMVRQEVLDLRDLMHALRPIDFDGDQLPEALAGVVERFRRDSGVAARFVSTGGRPTMPTAMALEIVRIVQEALVNVRKHSRARNVLVRLDRQETTCSLIVEDDGCGLEFEGRWTADELDRRRIGPAIIRERARIAGLALTLDSTPGEGTRVELAFGEAAHG